MPVRSGVARFRLVVTSTRDGVNVYPGTEEIPQAELAAMKNALEGENAAGMVIADRGGIRRMGDLLKSIEDGLDRSKPKHVPPFTASQQIGLGFITAGSAAAALLIWAWLR